MINFKNELLKHIPIHKLFFQRSYSQYGEDMLLRGFCNAQKAYKGYYVDVGAHHPYIFSNSMHFYQKGWRGINIEPYPAAHKLFKIFRRKDINLNMGISAQEQELTYYCFKDASLNTFSKDSAEELDMQANNHYITKAIPIKTLPLRVLFDRYLPPGQEIDFLSINTASSALQTLQSNDWKLYQPAHVLIADKPAYEEIKHASSYQFLIDKSYRLSAQTRRMLLFSRKKNVKNVFSSSALKR